MDRVSTACTSHRYSWQYFLARKSRLVPRRKNLSLGVWQVYDISTVYHTTALLVSAAAIAYDRISSLRGTAVVLEERRAPLEVTGVHGERLDGQMALDKLLPEWKRKERNIANI